MAQALATQKNAGGRLAPRRENPLERLHRDFDALFGRMWGGLLPPISEGSVSVRIWDFDVQETDKEIVIRAEIPGFEERELDVQINNEVLTIKAEKEQKEDGREERLSFFRSVPLPPGIDTEKVQATYRNGVLELHIPRAQGSQLKRIQVQGEQAAAGQQGQPTSKQATAGQAGATASQK
jgi:HSP20 family protein